MTALPLPRRRRAAGPPTPTTPTTPTAPTAPTALTAPSPPTTRLARATPPVPAAKMGAATTADKADERPEATPGERLSDRIHVMNEGALVAGFDAAEATQERILRAIVSSSPHAASH